MVNILRLAAAFCLRTAGAAMFCLLHFNTALAAGAAIWAAVAAILVWVAIVFFAVAVAADFVQVAAVSRNSQFLSVLATS